MPTSRAFRLLIADGPDAGLARELALEGSRGYALGTAQDLDVVLTDPTVAARHAIISPTCDLHGPYLRVSCVGGSYFRYQGARLREGWLPPSSNLTVGNTTIITDLVDTNDSEVALEPSRAERFGGLTGRSEGMRRLFALLQRIAPTDAPIVIHGETGTGKEVCAEAVHRASLRSGAPFVVCDLSAITPSLIESELFGHVRGAFTSAHRDYDGAFIRARGGTLFLDEIGELDLALQPRLLRALERKQIKPVGGDAFTEVDVRIIAATNRDLAVEVSAGRFRTDLLHRLAVVQVEIPALRARREDLSLLIEELSEGPLPLSAAALDALLAHPFPGNVRELRNILVRARALARPDEAITPALLGLRRGALAVQAEVQPYAPHFEVPLAQYQTSKELFEARYVTELLRRAGGNVSRAARDGGLDRAHLHRLIRKHRSKAGWQH